MSISPGHRGALDVYVPLVDWGARFEAIRAPIRHPGRPPDRRPPGRHGPRGGQPLDVKQVREEARERARRLPQAPDRLDRAVRAGARPAGGVRDPQPGPAAALDAFRSRSSSPSASASRWSVLIPPRGEISDPQYYAHGPDIPRALEAVEAARRTSGVLDQELDAQLVGLARLVVDPGRRQSLARPPGDHRRLRPAQQPVRARRAGPDRRRRPGVLRRRPDRPRFPARDAAGAPRGAQREAVRVRVGQPRLRLPLARAGAARARSCSRATAGSTPTATTGPVINKIQRPAGRGLRRPVRAPWLRVLPRPLRRRRPTPSSRRSSWAGCSR